MVVVEWLLPVASFLLVFFVVFAVFAKTKLLGENSFFHVLVSLLLATFFVINASMIDFVSVSAGWVIVLLICLFFIFLIVGFVQGKLDVVMKPVVAWVLIAVVIFIFIISSSYSFSWAVNWPVFWNWFYSDWFAVALTLVIIGAVSWIVTQK